MSKIVFFHDLNEKILILEESQGLESKKLSKSIQKKFSDFGLGLIFSGKLGVWHPKTTKIHGFRKKKIKAFFIE